MVAVGAATTEGRATVRDLQRREALVRAARDLQRRDALVRANEIRAARKEIKRQLHTGELSVEAALEAPDAQGMMLLTIVGCQPGWGLAKIHRLQRRLLQLGVRVDSYRAVRTLTPRQRELLLRLVSAHATPRQKRAMESEAA